MLEQFSDKEKAFIEDYRKLCDSYGLQLAPEDPYDVLVITGFIDKDYIQIN